MLSILIPTFNHLTTNLVKDLQLQCLESKIIFEIIQFSGFSRLNDGCEVFIYLNFLDIDK